MSGELATLLSGRYVEIEMLPLSFKEYLSFFNDNTDIQTRYRKYLENSSFPYVLQLNDEKEQLKQKYNSLQRTAYRIDRIAHEDREYAERLYKQNQQLEKENEQLKQDIENLKTTLVARETLIDVCEKKFRELGYIITVDDDGYVIE